MKEEMLRLVHARLNWSSFVSSKDLIPKRSYRITNNPKASNIITLTIKIKKLLVSFFLLSLISSLKRILAHLEDATASFLRWKRRVKTIKFLIYFLLEFKS